MASGISGAAQLRNTYGIRVDRAAGNLAQTGNLNLFTVSGGRVLVTTILGEVTTVIQAQADAVKLQSVSTVGAVTTDLCATVDVASAAVSTLYGLTGTAATAAVIGSVVPQTNEMIMQAGVIRMNAAASNTGQMKWTVLYVPLDAGATVTAA